MKTWKTWLMENWWWVSVTFTTAQVFYLYGRLVAMRGVLQKYALKVLELEKSKTRIEELAKQNFERLAAEVIKAVGEVVIR